MTIVLPTFRHDPEVQRWTPVLVTPASTLAIEVADAKLHLRMSPDVTAEDGLVATWIRAATMLVEKETAVELLSKTYDLVADEFPGHSRPIDLPFGPLRSVTHIKSYDSATVSVLQTMTAADYVADTTRIPGRIGLADGATWPTDLRQFQPVTIRVVVGHASIALVPEPLLQAIRLAIAWQAMNREPTEIERASFDWLIAPYLFGGYA